jgi:DNA-binding MarR family transcriptional regulator
VADAPTAERITATTHQLDVAMTELTKVLARDAGISVPEMLALEHLTDGDGLGPSELARRLQMSTGALTALADRLEASGHIVRERHPSDRRRVVLRSTSLARDDLTAEAGELAAEVLAFSESFSDAERAVIGRFLGGLVDIIERRVAESCER